jgi:tetratricopeptide (TPR) repeat protein
LLGDFEGALHSFEQALATGAMRNLEGYFLGGIALAQLRLGDPARARRTAEHAITVARQRGHQISECEAQCTLAQILTKTEGASAAAEIETALREVERLIAETGARSNEPLLHEERARLADALGDAAGRERALGEARRLFTEMGATGHLERLDREWGRA